VVEQIVANTDGVPLFVEELTKMVLESGPLRERAKRYELTGPLPPPAIPTTLHDSLMARLDRLAAVKAMAQLGATLGREFSYALLHAVSPWDEGTLQRGLQQLVAAEFLVSDGKSWPENAPWLNRDEEMIHSWVSAEGSGTTKIPYYIRSSEGSCVAFAGLYDTRTSAKGEELQAFTVVTRGADELMARLHQRMAVVLAREDEQAWPDPDVTAPIQAMEIHARSAGVHLDAYPASRMVDKSSTEGELLIQRAAYMSSTIAALPPRSTATSAGHGRRPAGVSRHMVLL
jgi:hypothetical protein